MRIWISFVRNDCSVNAKKKHHTLWSWVFVCVDFWAFQVNRLRRIYEFINSSVILSLRTSTIFFFPHSVSSVSFCFFVFVVSFIYLFFFHLILIWHFKRNSKRKIKLKQKISGGLSNQVKIKETNIRDYVRKTAKKSFFLLCELKCCMWVCIRGKKINNIRRKIQISVLLLFLLALQINWKGKNNIHIQSIKKEVHQYMYWSVHKNFWPFSPL